MIKALIIALCIQLAFALPNFLETCFTTAGTVCLNGTSHVLGVTHQAAHILAHWTFDDMFAVDSTKSRSHLHPGLRPGPPVEGDGASGYLSPSNPAAVASFTSSVPCGGFAFWLYPVDDKRHRSILCSDGFQVSLSSNNILQISNSNGVVLSSSYKIKPRFWTHIAVHMGVLYVDGMEDGQHDFLFPNQISRVTIGSCGTLSSIEAYIDDVVIFNNNVDQLTVRLIYNSIIFQVSMIKAGSRGYALAQQRDPLVTLGCYECIPAEAATLDCGRGHICSRNVSVYFFNVL